MCLYKTYFPPDAIRDPIRSIVSAKHVLLLIPPSFPLPFKKPTRESSPVPLITRFLDSTRRLVDRVREIRDDPPEGLGRTPGPKAILSSLNRDEALKEEELRLPRSTRTIHRILHENGRIASRLPRLTDPLDRPEPMEHWH